jgi:heptosyltransferase-2
MAKKFLIINPFGIGDVVFSTPLIANLKESFPEADIFYLCNRKAAPIMESHPFIKKVFIYERDDFVAEQKSSFLKGMMKYLNFILQIRKERIDCAIDLSLNTHFGFFAFAAGIKDRYGLDYKNRSRFLKKKIKIEGFTDKHVADYYLDVLKLLDIPVNKHNLKVYSDAASKAWVKRFLEKNAITKEELVIGVAPCGGDAFGKDNHLRRWPPEYYASLINRLKEELKAKVFIFAGPKENNDVTGIMNLLKDKDDVFEFCDSSLPITIVLVDRCRLFISNDTGILRFADGLDKKIVVFYGPIDEKVYGPYLADNNRVIILKKDLSCRPCYSKFRLVPCRLDRECLKSISVDEAIDAVKKLLVSLDRKSEYANT